MLILVTSSFCRVTFLALCPQPHCWHSPVTLLHSHTVIVKKKIYKLSNAEIYSPFFFLWRQMQWESLASFSPAPQAVFQCWVAPHLWRCCIQTPSFHIPASLLCSSQYITLSIASLPFFQKCQLYFGAPVLHSLMVSHHIDEFLIIQDTVVTSSFAHGFPYHVLRLLTYFTY